MKSERACLDPNTWRSDAAAMSRVSRKLTAALIAAALVLGSYMVVAGVNLDEAAAHRPIRCAETETVWVEVNGSYLDHWETRCVRYEEIDPDHEHWYEDYVPEWVHDVISPTEYISTRPKPLDLVTMDNPVAPPTTTAAPPPTTTTSSSGTTSSK